jgi:hypothetical protein
MREDRKIPRRNRTQIGWYQRRVIDPLESNPTSYDSMEAGRVSRRAI